MRALEVKAGSAMYEVHIGEGIRHNCAGFLARSYSAVLIITDSVVADLYLDDVLSAFSGMPAIHHVVVPAGEASKNITQFYQLQTEAIRIGLDRKSLIVALGGGVIGDLAGFVAATFMRGIDFIQIPTTILAHDSSVGGKVGINHENGKNLIGSFHQPASVIYDVETLMTLPPKEVRSGYAEIIKHGLIQDRDLFDQLTSGSKIEEVSAEELENQLSRGIAVKASIVEKDEKESNLRKFLNFGHTLGHALEAELGYGTLTHGEAVAIGMLFAIQVSQEELEADLPYEALRDWMKRNKYPLELQGVSVASIVEKMKHDKKAEKGIIQMVLLEEVGKPVVRELDDGKVAMLAEKFFREMAGK